MRQDRFAGLGARKANLAMDLSDAVNGLRLTDLAGIEKAMVDQSEASTSNKYGDSAISASSIAVAKAAACFLHKELFEVFHSAYAGDEKVR